MINWRAIAFILRFVLVKLALLLLIPILYAWVIGSASWVSFALSLLAVCGTAGLLQVVAGGQPRQWRVQELFISTTAAWVLAALLSALPFLLSVPQLSLTDAFFESMSGLTTTGSSVLQELSTLAPPLLLWRSLLQWVGGVGFMVMAVALLPVLDVGGMRLFHTESSDCSEKTMPRMQGVAQQIIAVYMLLTLLCYLGFCACGLSQFEAINHALTTISTGGFSTVESSIAQLSPAAQWNTTLFMLLASLPLLLLMRALSKRTVRELVCDQQVRGFLGVVLLLTPVLSGWLWIQGCFPLTESVRLVCFNLVNILSTTGYSLGRFDEWSAFSTLVFALLLVVGGCSGSTVGGIKLFRLQICLSLFTAHVKRLIHPNVVVTPCYNGQPISETVSRSVIAFMVAFFCVIIVLALILALCGLDPLTALTGAMAAVANVGTGMGPQIGPVGHFAELPSQAKWCLALGMLIGRLEIMTLLVLLSPAFWRE
jgi:trk system potassium uptake protein TrkH